MSVICHIDGSKEDAIIHDYEVNDLDKSVLRQKYGVSRSWLNRLLSSRGAMRHRDGKKTCNLCSERKILEDFYVKTNGNHEGRCKQCCRKKCLTYYNDTKPVRRKKGRLSAAIYRKANGDKIKAYRIENAEKLKEGRKDYYRRNKTKINAKRNLYFSQRRKTDAEFRLKHYLRTRINAVLRKVKGEKSNKSVSLLGCSFYDLKNHLESRFQEGMTWENHGVNGWHIDHIKPCASFDLTDPEQQKQCFHYTNLQPLWGSDNLRKGDRV